jgi:hypothetical protein
MKIGAAKVTHEMVWMVIERAMDPQATHEVVQMTIGRVVDPQATMSPGETAWVALTEIMNVEASAGLRPWMDPATPGDMEIQFSTALSEIQMVTYAKGVTAPKDPSATLPAVAGGWTTTT